ncbi:MAG: tetraacyldisaccharide 4'-kinase [Bdellovibrionales bacterium]
MKSLLRPLAWLYGKIANLHRQAYERGWLKTLDVRKPVLSVGNLSMGGTGKTPFVLQLVGDLLARGLRPAIVTRSYRAKQRVPHELSVEDSKNPRQFGDEACLYKIRNPKFRVFTGAQKARVAFLAAQEKETQLVVVDDGFQHHRLKKDWNGVLLDCTRIQDWKTFPEGTLREDISALKKADAIFLTRTELVQPQVVEQVKGLLPAGIPVFPLETRYLRLRTLEGNEIDRAPEKVGVVCALGNPQQFEDFVKKQFPKTMTFPFFFRDHHHYSPAEVGYLERELTRLQLDYLVTTEKDEAKLKSWVTKNRNWAVVDIGTEIKDAQAWKIYWDKKLNELVGT